MKDIRVNSCFNKIKAVDNIQIDAEPKDQTQNMFSDFIMLHTLFYDVKDFVTCIEKRYTNKVINIIIIIIITIIIMLGLFSCLHKKSGKQGKDLCSNIKTTNELSQAVSITLHKHEH